MEDQDSDRNDANKKVNRKSKLFQPVGTVEYTVRNHDTLTSLAAQYDTTPSEVCKLNKLSTRFIFPGQVLYVPDQEYYSSGASDSCGSGPASPVTSSPSPAPALNMAVTSGSGSTGTSPAHNISKTHDIPIVRASGGSRHASISSPISPLSPPKRGPGVAERIDTMTAGDEPVPRPLTEDEAQKLDRECLERFIKINVKHITDGQGVVSGTLLVTPNAIMFDPNVSDLLVIDRGADTYGMIAPMDTVISVAMYHDIAAMKLKSKSKELLEEHAGKHKVYHSPNCPVKCRMPSQQQVVSPTSRPDQVTTTQEEDDTLENIPFVHDDSCSLKPPPDLESSHSSSEGLHGLTDEGLHDLETELAAKSEPASDNAQNSNSELLSTPSFAKTVTFSDIFVTDSVSEVTGIASQDTDTAGEDKTSSITNIASEDKTSSITNITSEVKTSSITNITSEVKTGIASQNKTSQVTDSAGEVTGSAGEVTGSAGEVTGSASEVTGIASQDKTSESHEEARQRKIIADVKASRRYDSQEHGIGFLERLEDESQPESKTDAADRSSGLFNMSFSPNFTSFVDFSSGLFSKDDRSKVKDITEVNTREPPSEVKELSSTLEKDASPVNLSPATLRRADALIQSEVGREGPTPATDLVTSHGRGHHNAHAHAHNYHFATTKAGASASWLSHPLQRFSETMSGPPKHDEEEHNMKPHREVAVESLVKMDDRPELFQSLDDLIPKPAQYYEDPPLYLCLKVGVPIKKRMSSVSHIDTNKKKKKPEYWFSIPWDRVDNLYAFFIQWSPNLYGGEDEMSDPKERGFVVIEEEQDEDEVQVDFVRGRLIRNMSKDWEILNVAEARRRMTVLDVEETLPLPDLHGETVILTEDHVTTLTKILPARAEGYPWTLIYSSDQNGFSLGTIYRAMQGYDCPVLLVIKDTSNNVFGALTSCPIKYNEHFYGTGESFLYSFYQEFKVYSWSGENNFFIKGNKEGLAIGSGNGTFGIWVDGDLYHGRTQHCDTFDNQPLTSQEDFVIKGFEAWGFF